jgi:predicted nucleic acid-binding protein
MWMLDTDICIALIKRQPPELITKLKKHKPGEVAISAITLAELRFGVSKSAQPEKIARRSISFSFLSKYSRSMTFPRNATGTFAPAWRRRVPRLDRSIFSLQAMRSVSMPPW